MSRSSRRYPCVFSDSFTKEQIDPRVQREWMEAHGKGAPFGDLRRSWKGEHCATINPYGSDSCPYAREECATAFLSAVQTACSPGIRNSAAYFKKVAKSTGLTRAENKPLARDRRDEGSSLAGGGGGGLRPGRTPGMAPFGGVHPSQGVVPEVLDEEDHLRRARTRPVSIGSLLGSNNDRAREERAARREASRE